MVKIVIIGSLRFEPYEIVAAPKTTGQDSDSAYEYYKQYIDQAEVVIVFNPDGIGDQTFRDAAYAVSKGKYVCVTHPDKPLFCLEDYKIQGG